MSYRMSVPGGPASEDKMRRLVEADILRTVAIVLIVLTHLPDYFPVPGLQPYTTYTILLGNGLFIFLSGYLIHTSTRARPRSSLASLMGHRLLRLMPLYWLALATFVVLVVRPDPLTLVLHLAGLQVLLAPAVVTPMATLWFIGMILAFYLIYYAVVRHVSGPLSLSLVAVIALLPLVAIRSTTDLLEVRFFLYYFVFMAGVVVCESGVLERARPGAIILPLVLSITLLALFVLDGSPLSGESSDLAIGLDLIVSMAIANAMIISWALLGWLAAKGVAPHLRPWAVSMFAACSIASYFVYLFHRPLLVALSSVLDHTDLAVPVQYLAALLVAVPVLFLVGYRVQRSVDRQTSRLLERAERVWSRNGLRDRPIDPRYSKR